ncbi:hypothetical protein N7456_010900 [Penicillium angulare]|uniref:Arca-like protein n=1 Tax=Penicillium angulare TaxID=116970 RepID=A0A9W9JZ70_9EURO|nr:hypothetical protein N7456_010900 [Penicillium angulare]
MSPAPPIWDDAGDNSMNDASPPRQSRPEHLTDSPSDNTNTVSVLQNDTSDTSPETTALFSGRTQHERPPDQYSPFPIASSPHSSLTSNLHTQISTASYGSHSGKKRHFSEIYTPASNTNQHPLTPYGTVQESCLVKYFTEELSPWFDHCDDFRHFQLVVPRRAKHCTTLRNAICAVAALHLGRLPKYKTSQGLVYCGQPLPHVTKSSALEYMLKCIPDLIQFPEIQDPEHQENIMAATVILRQYEEMEEELDENSLDGEYFVEGRVNFLAITQTIIDSMVASPMDQSLATAAYWITVRQETYYALTRETVPHLRFDVDFWQSTSVANNMIVFASQVARWRWGQKQPEEWAQLKHTEQQLTHDSIGVLDPILDLEPDRKKGEIFPTIWYSFDVQVTAIQHFRLAQMILTAENPHLENATRAAHRKLEAQVRSIVLNICGIGLNHPRVQPALLNAVIAITMYGEYFTDPQEREALVDIINRTKEMHTWPMRRPYQTLQQRWDMMDNAEI